MNNKQWYVKKIKSSSAKVKHGATVVYQSIEEHDSQLKQTTGKGLFHTYTEKGGDFVGKVIGTPVRLIGKKTNNTYVEEIADSLHSATKFTGGVAGQIGQGTWKTIQGVTTKNKADLVEGVGEYKSVTGRAVTAIYKTTKYTLKNSGAIIHGVYSKDYPKAKIGLKGVGKVLIVGAVAITVFDLVEGEDVSAAENGDFLVTHNSHLDGQLHPQTGVPYEAQTVELSNGNEVVGVFPLFDGVAEVEMPPEMYESSDYTHFSYANQELIESVNSNTAISNQFTAEQLEQIYAGETPDGYTWHHHEQAGKLQLVDEEVHATSSHSGGRFIWGGGSDAR